MKRKSDTSNEQVERSRSSRMYEENGNWFFNTREGTVVGPFRDKLEACTQLEVYIRMAGSGMLRLGEPMPARELTAESTG